MKQIEDYIKETINLSKKDELASNLSDLFVFLLGKVATGELVIRGNASNPKATNKKVVQRTRTAK